MTHGNNGFLCNFFLPLFYYYYIFNIFGSLCTIEKIYNNNKIMVKKIKIKKLN